MNKKLLAKLLVIIAAPASAGLASAATDPAATEGEVKALARAALEDPALTEAARAAIAAPKEVVSDNDGEEVGGVDLWPTVEPGLQMI